MIHQQPSKHDTPAQRGPTLAQRLRRWVNTESNASRSVEGYCTYSCITSDEPMSLPVTYYFHF